MSDLKRQNPETGEWEEFDPDDDKAWRYDERRDRFEFLSPKELKGRRFWRYVLMFAVYVVTFGAAILFVNYRPF